MSRRVILFQGDSVTDCGRGRDVAEPNEQLGSGYADLIAARLLADHPERDYAVYNRGVSGNRVVDLYARWKADALNLQPDILSILIGVNDTWHEFNWANGVEVERYNKIYRMLLDWTKQALPKTKLLLCEPFVLNFGAVAPEWLPEMAQRAEIVKQLAIEYKAIFVPFQSVISIGAAAASPERILYDGVHPRLAGHQLMADAWLRAAKPLLN